MNPDLLKNLPPDRKTLIRMRMELRRQQMRKEVIRVAEPAIKLKAGYDKLSNSYLPLLGLAGTVITSLFMRNKRPIAPVNYPAPNYLVTQSQPNKWLTIAKAAIPIAGIAFGFLKSRKAVEEHKKNKAPFHLY